MMNIIAVPFVLPFQVMARFPWPSTIASAAIALFCYVMNYGSGLAFFVCLACGIFIWNFVAGRQPAAAPLGDA